MSSLNENFLHQYAKYAGFEEPTHFVSKSGVLAYDGLRRKSVMFWYDFSFRSLTAAQDGRSVLEHVGIGAELLRAPQAISEQGCGYVVETADFEGARAFEQFLANGVRFRRVFRRYENGMVEEAGHDLF